MMSRCAALLPTQILHVVRRRDFRAQLAALGAQQRALAFHVYQAQFRRGTVREHVADGALRGAR